jgi:hypothetical protein
LSVAALRTFITFGRYRGTQLLGLARSRLLALRSRLLLLATLRRARTFTLPFISLLLAALRPFAGWRLGSRSFAGRSFRFGLTLAPRRLFLLSLRSLSTFSAALFCTAALLAARLLLFCTALFVLRLPLLQYQRILLLDLDHTRHRARVRRGLERQGRDRLDHQRQRHERHRNTGEQSEFL